MKTLKFDQPQMSLYIKSMGRLFKVTAVCKTDDEANEICAKDRDQAVMGCDVNGLVYLCQKYSSSCSADVIKDL